jgi:hypothetical protein
VVYGTYRVLSNNIGSLASGIDSALTNAQEGSIIGPAPRQVAKALGTVSGGFSFIIPAKVTRSGAGRSKTTDVYLPLRPI